MYNIPNYNFYQQQPIQQPAVPVNLKGRPVASFEEVRAASVDFDGSIFYFPDVANKCIYTKQINMDGTATLNMYEFKELPVAAPVQNNNFVTRDEFEQVVAQLKAALTPATITPQTAPPQSKPVLKEF